MDVRIYYLDLLEFTITIQELKEKLKIKNHLLKISKY